VGAATASYAGNSDVDPASASASDSAFLDSWTHSGDSKEKERKTAAYESNSD